LKSWINKLSYSRDITVASRKIDSTEGSIASFEDMTLASALYMVLYVPICDNHLIANIITSYPWDEGTLQLLKTIHIEKLNTTK
jgi:hypothetical protein